MDPSENVYDYPVLYESNWSKTSISYIIAFSKEEIRDVTERYVLNWQDTLEKRVLFNEHNYLQLLDSSSA